MRAVTVVLTLSWAVVACGPDLGTCDMPKAQTIVYLNGTPFVEGQALMHQSCAGSFCHASGATGAARSGAPHGLDFDVQPMTMQSTVQDLAVLQAGIGRIRDEAEELWSIVESGEMPPGKAGDRLDLAWYADAAGTVSAMLTGVDLDEARQKVRNWLACQAPIVAATTDSPQAVAVRSLNFGAVMEPGKSVIGPTFPSIYENLLRGCATCHSGSENYANLDFKTVGTAYTSLVSKASFAGSGAKCFNRPLVTPGDCAQSLLYQKLGQATNPCGDPMPLIGGPASEASRDAVCQWIRDGARMQ